MLSLNQTYDDRRLMRVLVAPVGNNSLFSEQFQVVSSLREIPYYELNRPQYAKTYTPPFKFVNWIDGALVFQYLRYDRASGGPGDLDDFQSSKRLLMVMGLINYPELIQDSKSLEEEIESFNRRYPHIYLKRFFVFNYNFDSPSTPPPTLSPKMQFDPDMLVIFPPEGDCEGGSMVEFHFKIVMCNAAVKIILYLEKQMEICEDARVKNVIPNEIALVTLHDDRDDILLGKDGNAANATSVKHKKAFKKKPAGRIRKWMGDLCMQVGSPVDAVEHYVSAIAECRSLGDHLWLAGALDGYASAILMLKTMNINLDEIIGKDLKTVNVPFRDDTEDTLPDVEKVYLLTEERANEAISVYSSSVVLRILEVECCLRLALMFELAEPFYEREQKVVEYVMRAAAVPGLNTQQQIECTLEGALICYRLGLIRKYALFLYIAALMTAESGNYDMADALLLQTCEQIGATEVLDDFSAISKEEIDGEKVTAWNSIKSSIFTNGIMLAREAQQSTISAKFLASLLNIMSRTELKHSMQRERFSKYDRKKLGLEKFVKRRKSDAHLNRGLSNNQMSSPATLTEDTLRKLHSTNSTHSMTGHSTKNGDPSRAVKTNGVPSVHYAGETGRAKSTVSDLPKTAANQAGLSRQVPSLLGDIAVESGKRRANFNPMTKLDNLPTIEEGKQSNPVNNGNNDDFLGTHISELTQAAESAIKSGLRNLSVPKLPNKLAAFVEKSQEIMSSSKVDPALRKLQQYDQKRRNSLGGDRLLRSFLNENSSLEIENTVAEESNALFHLVELDHARDILSSVATYLTAQYTPLEQQESALNMLYMLAEHLETPLEVSLPIFLTSLQPMELVNPQRPLPTKLKAYEQAIVEAKRITSSAAETSVSSEQNLSSSAESKSAFFYDPFAAKRDKSQQRDVEVYWPCNSLCIIIAVFMNPLSQPLKLSQVKPVVSGVQHIMYPLEVEIPSKTDYFEVEFPIRILSQGVLKIEGLLINIGNLSQLVSVNSEGYIQQDTTNKSPLFNDGDVYNVTTNIMTRYKSHHHRSTPTNLVNVVDFCYDVGLTLSWVADDSVAAKTGADPTGTSSTASPAEKSDSVSAISTALDLYAGEVRSENLWIHIPSASMKTCHTDGVVYKPDVRVSCTEHFVDSLLSEKTRSTSYAPTEKQYCLKEFRYLEATESSSNINHNNNVVVVKPGSKPPPPVLPPLIQNVQVSEVIPDELMEISLDMHCKEQVKSLTLEVEVLCLHPVVADLLQLLQELKQQPTAEEAEQKKASVRRLYTEMQEIQSVSQDVLYSRKIRLSIDIQQKTGIVLQDLKLCQASSKREMKQLGSVLAQSLKSAYEVNYLLSTSLEQVRHQGRPGSQSYGDLPTVRYLTEDPLLMLQIANLTAFEAKVGISATDLVQLTVAEHNDKKDAATKKEQRSHSLLRKYEDFIAEQTSLLTNIGKASTLNAFLTYHSAGQDATAEELAASANYLYWLFYDFSRVKKIFANGSFVPCSNAEALVRVGSLMTTRNETAQRVSIAPSSGIIQPLLASIPKINPVVDLLLNKQSIPWEVCDKPYLRIPTTTFVDLHIAVLAKKCPILKTTQELEVITVIVEETRHHYSNPDSAMFRKDGSMDSDDEEDVDDEMSIVSSSEAFSEAHHMGYILSGKLHTRYNIAATQYPALLGRTGADESVTLVQHQLQLCFLRPGKYSMRCLVKLHPQDSSQQGEDVWWTSEQEVVAMVYSP